MPLVRLPGVFRPVSDAHLLIEHLQHEPLPRDAEVIDLCTGTGVIAISAARSGARVTAVDVSRRAVISTKVNAALAGVRVQTRRGDLFSPIAGRRAHVITANPPCLPSIERDPPPPRGRARAWEGGADGRRLIDRICSGARAHLRPGGVLLMVHSSIIGVERTLDAMAGGGLSPTIVARERGPVGELVHERAGALRARGFLHPEQQEEDLVVIRGAAPAMTMSPGMRWSGWV